ncbi:hypothetical protein [Sphingomonas abietis]|uniref:Circumsporozoite protein n=1 Tax=Sphingomonas abietis TaxID=3012344 RepID=A0ABY7NR74_9SPHN|nr:hypothetical protein [Sphingomonas abietis]WBO23465.1 hypothetical protein PBT88_04875 [Sphingomonas abietis]
MRNILKTLTATSLVVGGALLVAACGHSDNTATTDTNMSNMDTMDSSSGMTNDASAMDATANDAATGGNATGNAM